MKLLITLLCICGFGTAGSAQKLTPTSFKITKITRGNLSLDGSVVTFRTKDVEERYPFAEPKTSGTSPVTPEIPGLHVVSFEPQSLTSGSGGPQKDISILTLTTSDGSILTLKAGTELEVYKVEITIEDRQHQIYWQLPSDLGNIRHQLSSEHK